MTQPTPSEVRLQDLSELRVARETLWRVWGVHSGGTGRTGECPWPQPVSLQRADLARLHDQADSYRVAVKADGQRFLLMLTMRDGEPVALMFDAALRPYEVSIWGPSELFALGTVVDGELVRKPTGGLVYLAFDVVVLAGRRVEELAYPVRLELLRERLDLPDGVVLDEKSAESLVAAGKFLVMDHDCDLRLCVKPAVPLTEVAQLWSARHELGYSEDGLVFTHIIGGKRLGKQTDMFKWKKDHTVDVCIERCRKRPRCNGESMGMWEASTRSGTRAMPLCDKVRPQLTVYPKGRPAFRTTCEVTPNHVIEASGFQRGVVECSMRLSDEGIIVLTPVRMRPDKVFPNQVSTIQNTLGNVLDNVSIDDILQALALRPVDEGEILETGHLRSSDQSGQFS